MDPVGEVTHTIISVVPEGTGTLDAAAAPALTLVTRETRTGPDADHETLHHTQIRKTLSKNQSLLALESLYADLWAGSIKRK